MINALLKGVMNLIMGLVSLVLMPLDVMIEAALPDLASAISAIGAMFKIALSCMSFAIDVSGLSSAALELIVVYYGFKIPIVIASHTIKTAVKWYNKLKP